MEKELLPLWRAIQALQKKLQEGVSGGTAAHATSHQSGGTDAIKLDDLAATDDNTDLDASAAKHGLMPKWTSTLISSLLDLISTTRGAILYRGAATWAALSPGTATHVLTSNGAGADPSYQAPSGVSGAQVLISEQTPSGTGTVTFSSISGAYRDLRLVVRARSSISATVDNVTLQFNNDTGGNYDRQRMGATQATNSAAAAVAQTSLIIGNIPGDTATADHAGTVRCEIFDYRGTTFDKNTHSQDGYGTSEAAAGQNVDIWYGAWRSTVAITEIDVTIVGGNFMAGSVVSLYGVL